MYCIHCGAELPTIAKFCRDCGNAVTHIEAEKQETQKSPQISGTSSESRTEKLEADTPINQSAPDQSKKHDFLTTVPPDHDVYYHAIRGFESVKNGFSWPAFFLGFWWSLYKRLWLKAVLYWVVILVPAVLIGFIFGLTGTEGAEFVYYLYAISVSIVWGANGNNWVRNKLIKIGYERVREGLGNRADPTQNFQSDSEGSALHEHRFNCPFCQNAMANYGRCFKCGNTVDQCVLNANR